MLISPKLRRLLLIWVILVSFASVSLAYSGGSGTQADPYKIANADDLVNLGNTTADYGKYFIMTADIDLAGRTFDKAVIAGDTVIDDYFDGVLFTGDFNGNGRIIYNLTVNGGDYCGLFGCINSGGAISNLGLISVNITGAGDDATPGKYVGGLCGCKLSGTISNCYSSGLVSGVINVGGLCGYNSSDSINNCYATGAVTGYMKVGGLCGENNFNGSIISSYATGAVTGFDSYVGGLCGWNDGSISSSYASGAVSGSCYVGGLCGWNCSSISSMSSIVSSYASGAVTGFSEVGGLCGENEGSIISSYASGAVTSSRHVGGLCGINSSGSIIRSYWDKEASGQVLSSGGWGLTTAQMKQATSYYGWTDGSWTIDEGNNYPHLTWENASGTVINTDYPAKTYTGQGTKTEPYELADAAGLLCLSYRDIDWDKSFVLTANIDLGGQVFNYPIIGNGSYFSGRLDGAGHIVSNFTIYAPTQNYVGFVSQLSSGAVITDLGLENMEVTGFCDVGGLCGYNERGSIISSYATGVVTGYGVVGGLCGVNWYGSIIGSYATGAVTSFWGHVGGLCGGNFYGSISSSYASGKVIGTDNYVGGLCGKNEHGSIISSYASGAVTGYYGVGGLCGNNFGIISSSYASGAVTGYSEVGGLCGKNYSGSISNSYTTGAVTSSGSYVGGLCGYNERGSIISSYASGAVSGTGSYVGGLCGRNYGSPAKIMNCFWDTQTSGRTVGYTNSFGMITNVQGLTTVQMQTQSYYIAAGWDFVGEVANGTADIWYMSGGSYPKLSWQKILGDIAGSAGVDMTDLEVLAGNWLGSGLGDINADGQVDMLDFAVMAGNWLK